MQYFCNAACTLLKMALKWQRNNYDIKTKWKWNHYWNSEGIIEKNSWDWKRQWNGVNQWYKDFSMCQELHMAKWVKENKWVTSWFTYTCKMAVQMVTAWLKLCMKTNHHSKCMLAAVTKVTFWFNTSNVSSYQPLFALNLHKYCRKWTS